MATLPPPYSQRDAARAQRYYMRSLRRPSMVGPVVLIVAGVIALLVETNKLNGLHLWDWYMRWWPLLLIAVGLLSLGEWWLDRRSMSRAMRSSGRAGTGILIARPGRHCSGAAISSFLRNPNIFVLPRRRPIPSSTLTPAARTRTEANLLVCGLLRPDTAIYLDMTQSIATSPARISWPRLNTGEF